MKTLRARVRGGRLILDQPTDLPEGTELELGVIDSGDDLDEAERAALAVALERSWEQAKAGETRPAADLLSELDSKK